MSVSHGAMRTALNHGVREQPQQSAQELNQSRACCVGCVMHGVLLAVNDAASDFQRRCSYVTLVVKETQKT